MAEVRENYQVWGFSRGPKNLPKSRNTKKQKRVYANFFKMFAWTFALFPVTRVGNPMEILQKYLFRRTFLFWVDFCGVDFPPLIFYCLRTFSLMLARLFQGLGGAGKTTFSGQKLSGHLGCSACSDIFCRLKSGRFARIVPFKTTLDFIVLTLFAGASNTLGGAWITFVIQKLIKV